MGLGISSLVDLYVLSRNRNVLEPVIFVADATEPCAGRYHISCRFALV